MIYDAEYDEAINAIGSLSSNTENEYFADFYSTLSNDLYNGLSLDTLSEGLIYEISLSADANNLLSRMAQHLYVKVDTSVANNYDHNPYVEEFEESRPIFNTEHGNLNIKEDIDVLNILLYPNPTNNHLYLRGVSKEMEIEFVDMFAKVVYSGTINPKTSNLDLSNLSSGIYIVQIKQGMEILKREKILISK